MVNAVILVFWAQLFVYFVSLEMVSQDMLNISCALTGFKKERDVDEGDNVYLNGAGFYGLQRACGCSGS
jgi:hypothetical protein